MGRRMSSDRNKGVNNHIPMSIAAKHVARLTSATPRAPENFGSSIDRANDGIQSAGRKNANDCRMAPTSKNQNDCHLKTLRSFGRRAFDVVTGSRPFTKRRHGARPISCITVNIDFVSSSTKVSYQNDCLDSQRCPEAIRIKQPLQQKRYNDSSRTCISPRAPVGKASFGHEALIDILNGRKVHDQTSDGIHNALCCQKPIDAVAVGSCYQRDNHDDGSNAHAWSA